MATIIKELTEAERTKLIINCSANLAKHQEGTDEYKANLKVLDMVLRTESKVKPIEDLELATPIMAQTGINILMSKKVTGEKRIWSVYSFLRVRGGVRVRGSGVFAQCSDVFGRCSMPG